MAGQTVTGPGARLTRKDRETTFTETRAAHELGLRRSELRLAIQLGRVRTVAAPRQGPGLSGGARAPGRRIARAEIARLQAIGEFPEALRAAVRTVSATQGARELGITSARFTRLARLGFLVPAAFYVNRYRTVVWLYLAQELTGFAESGAARPLLTDRLPAALRACLDEGTDLRARNWRDRYLTHRMRLADDPWARAAVAASLLGEDELADAVPDPYERAHLLALCPARPARALPGAPVADPTAELMTADGPDEVLALRASLASDLASARQEDPGPRPALRPTAPCARVTGDDRACAHGPAPCPATAPGTGHSLSAARPELPGPGPLAPRRQVPEPAAPEPASREHTTPSRTVRSRTAPGRLAPPGTCAPSRDTRAAPHGTAPERLPRHRTAVPPTARRTARQGRLRGLLRRSRA